MYRAFKIKEITLKRLVKNEHDYSDRWIENNKLEELQNNFTSLFFYDEPLNAEKIWDDCFPELDVPVFISHSSRDGALAKKFANWLYNTFEIESFIDSELWGHSDKLLRMIDNEYCFNEKRDVYDYEKRNASTAHVHIILTHALTRMIDHAECFIFIDSNNSISIKDSVSGIFSPWIFHELTTVNIIRENIPERHKQKRYQEITQNFSKSLSESREDLQILYPNLSKELKTLSSSDLELWEGSVNMNTSALDSLDILYELSSEEEQIIEAISYDL